MKIHLSRDTDPLSWMFRDVGVVLLLGAEAVDMNGRIQMQGGKNWILPK
jgi:hypothetical protein